MTRKKPAIGAYCAVIVSAFALVPSAFSQTPEPKPSEAAKAEDETILLSPFVVDASKDDGYSAKNTLAGTRIRTDLKDVGASISVMTSSFLKDTGSKNAEQLLVYSANTEVSGQGGNFLGQGDGPFVTASAANKPVENTRVRGLAEADNTRDFFVSDIPWDSYNTGRIDLQRGPNSILFGIGSPAGIVNASLNGAAFKNDYKVEGEIGSFGTIRLVGDFNQVILKDELAIRVSLLDDRTKYKQDPAFKNDYRVFGAVKWDPAVLRTDSARTSFRVNAERGRIDSNKPRFTPPIDTINPWFTNMNKATYDGRVLNNNQVGVLQSDGSVGNNVNNPWIGPIGNRVYDGVATTYNNGVQGFSFPTKVQNITDGNNGTVDYRPVAQVGNNGIKGIATTDWYAKQAQLPGAGSGLWKAASMTDASVFDFYNNLIEGPNKSEFNKFEALSAALSQTFFNDKVGLEVAYDFQNARWGNDTSMSNDGTTVTVDINETLLSSSVNPVTGVPTTVTPNPNVGRPMVVLGGGSAGVYREERTRSTVRATAFGEVNFNDILDKDSMIAKIFGRNTFTVLYAKQMTKDQNQKGPRWYLSSLYLNGTQPGNVSQGSRDNIILAYVGGDLRSKTSASGLGFQGLKEKINPQNSTIYTWDVNRKVQDPADSTKMITSPGWNTVPLIINNSDNYTDAAKTYTSAIKSKDVVKSSAVVWQGYWLDNVLIPMVGLRRDNLISQGAPGKGMAGFGGVVDINRTDWVLPNAADPTQGLTYQDVSGTSKTYSLVTHLPKSLRSKLPGNTDISLFVNKSENFKPESRRDLRGAALPSATGETKEFGFTITTLNDRLSFKAVHYETTVKNATINGVLNGAYLIGAVEWWGGSAARSQRDNTPGSHQNNGTATDGDHGVVTWQPDATNSAIFAAGVAANSAFDGYNTPGLASSGYRQDILNQTRASIVAATTDWFNKLAPADLQAAWEFKSTSDGVGNHDGNYSPSAMALTATTVSKGYEFEVVANPIDGLDVSFNASKTAAQRSELAASYGAWITQRWTDLQGPMGNIRIWGGQTGDETTRGKFRNETYADYLFFNALQGSDVPELSPWRFSTVANYGFKSGVLKGANFGASFRWQEAKIIGFLSKVAQDTISHTDIDVADLTKPVKGKSENAFDAWVGYEFKVFKNINWRIQFNVRDVFAKKDLIPNTIQPNGQIASYRIPEPRTYSLTNTFKF